jgi:hypothetical protein
VGRGDVSYPAGPDEADEVGFGSGRPRGRWRAAWLIVAVAVIAVVAVVVSSREKSASPPPHPAPLSFGVTEVGHPLLGVRAGWELYGYGPAGVARIQFARGRITWTAMPALDSGGPLAFLAGSGEVIIRPIDEVPGYAVPDGQRARPLAGLLGHGGTVIPGPDPGTVWVQPGFDATTIPLVRLDGRDAGLSMRLPSRGTWLASPDGQGYGLFSGPGTGVIYDVRPGRVRRVTGTLAAAGPTRWLVADCRSDQHCAYVVVDSASGARRTLPGLVPEPASAPGVIAADGSTAAIIRSAGSHTTLHLINLASGADQTIAVPLDQGSAFGQTLAWSPDSQWLFVITAHGGLYAVSLSTHRVESLGVTLPPLSQITVPGAGG